jgi:hypothetical protein
MNLMLIDANGWAVIIAALSLALTSILSLVLQFLAGRKAEAVRTDLKISTQDTTMKLNETTVKLDEMAKVNKQTHTLVNSNMEVQLKLNVVAYDRIAQLTKGTPEGPADERAAILARQLLADHLKKQREVDDINKK